MSLSLLVSACDDDEAAVATGGGVVVPGGPVASRFDMANGCFALKSLQRNAYVVKAPDLAATAPAAGGGEPFFMKPTALGKYLFYAKDRSFLAVDGDNAASATAPSDDSDWTVNLLADGSFSVVNEVAARTLAVNPDSGGLVLVATAPADGTHKFTFDAVSGCSAYPEMPTNIGETYTGPAAGEVIGFADIHAHMAMGSDMSDGTGDRGPSAGGVMYGHAVNRFGASEALKDCEEMHGPGGSTTAELVLDLEANENFLESEDTHDTVGWPSFVDWPARNSLLHQQMYYKFVERSYKAGLRLMVLHGTNIEALCDVGKKTVGDKTSDCSDMGVGLKQVAYAYDIQDYIDAQEGGPGKGWFRIAKDPMEAEAFIRAGKMAVVPGLEFSNIFKCNVTYTGAPRGEMDGDPTTEVVGCTTESIDEQIDEAWDAGVRGIYLYHDVDSALGGTGIFSAVLNLVNYYGTKGWWETYTCDDQWGGEDDQGYFYGAGTVPLGMGSSQLGALLSNPIGAALIENFSGILPFYPSTNQCNARGITPLGRYALEAAMKKGFVLDVDHAEISIKQDMLDEGAKTTPAYPMMSAHGGHGGLTNAQVLQMLKQGGIMYPGMVNGREYKGFYNKVEAIWGQMSDAEKAKYPIAVGYGADQTGLASQPGPRGGDGVEPVDYDEGFTLFRGAGWSERLLGLPAVPVSLLTIKPADCADCTDGKSWNVDEVGVAHYGMVPDVVEQIRIETQPETKYLDGFYNSAAAYLRLWKQTVAASLVRPDPARPDASTLPQYVPHPLDPTTGTFP
ncbi:MAG: peptidase M19 [Pseudomonadota bacterium]